MKKRSQTTRFKRKRLIYSFNTFKKYFELCFTPTAFIRSDSTTMWQQWSGLPEKVKVKVNSLVVFIHLILLRIIARPVFFSPSTFCSDPPRSTRPPCLAREHLTLRLRPHFRSCLALIIFIRQLSNSNIPRDPLMYFISRLLLLKHTLHDDRELCFIHFYIPNTRLLPDTQKNKDWSTNPFFPSILSCLY